MLKKLRIKLICTLMILAGTFIVTVTSIVVYRLYDELWYENEEYLAYRTDRYLNKAGDRPPRHMHLVSYFLAQKETDGSVTLLDSWNYDIEDGELLDQYYAAAQESPHHGGLLRQYNLRYLVSHNDRSIIAFMDSTNEMRVRRDMWKPCSAICLGCFAASFFISLLIARWLVKPVEKSWEQQNQFISDVSHELKTPLTVILTNTEMLQSEAPDNRCVSNIDVMSQQMRGLVESLLELARMDRGGETLEQELVDFSKVVFDAILPYEPIFYEKGLSFESDIAENITVMGSADHLLHVVNILLDNAQKYTSDSGSVSLKLSCAKGQCSLSVASTGEEISHDDLEKIFRRFYRVDKVRSMNHSYGLGLPIAKSIVERYRGRIWAESKNGVNTFFVTLPMK